MFQVPTLKIEQKGVAMFVTALPFSELRKHARVDYWKPDNEEGYQRPLVNRRLVEVAKYVTQEEGVLPTSVLVCIRDCDSNLPTFELKDKVGSFADWGILNIPKDATLWVIDGQHRTFGVNRAYERDDAADLADYPFPVTIMIGVERYTEMLNFNIVNTRQRKMSTDIVDRHLVMKAKQEGLKMIASGKRGEREYLRAKSTRITDKLNEEPGPWYHQIAIPGVVGKDKGLVRQHAVVVSLEPALKDPWLSVRTEDDVVKLLARYWSGLSELWAEAFDSPNAHRVQATVGLYSLHMVLPSVIQICLSEGDFSENKMHQIWKQTGIPSNFWHKEHGDPLTLGTGMASIRALAQYFRNELARKQTTVSI